MPTRGKSCIPPCGACQRYAQEVRGSVRAAQSSFAPQRGASEFVYQQHVASFRRGLPHAREMIAQAGSVVMAEREAVP